MEKVTGIGGIFFRARDPEALADWYQANLGIDLVPQGTDSPPWRTEAGITIFAPFAEDSDYFPAHNAFMLNFRVRDLDAMLAQLEAAGTRISHRQDMDGVGRFARIHDPEGNPLELWEPVS